MSAGGLARGHDLRGRAGGRPRSHVCSAATASSCPDGPGSVALRSLPATCLPITARPKRLLGAELRGRQHRPPGHPSVCRYEGTPVPFRAPSEEQELPAPLSQAAALIALARAASASLASTSHPPGPRFFASAMMTSEKDTSL